MIKVVYKKVEKCQDCPYFRWEHNINFDFDGSHEEIEWYKCGFIDKVLMENGEFEIEGIPEWCPLEDYDVWNAAIDSIKK